MSVERKYWRCPECGERYTLMQAMRVMENGCVAGCSGIDIEEIPASANTAPVIEKDAPKAVTP